MRTGEFSGAIAEKRVYICLKQPFHDSRCQKVGLKISRVAGGILSKGSRRKVIS